MQAGMAEPGESHSAEAPSLAHLKSATIREPGLDDRGSVFFAAIEMTRMPMILTDPRQPDNPIAFANRAFQDLTGYTQAELIGRNCRFLQGPETSRETVAELRQAVAERRAIATEILNYKRDGSPFWNGIFIGPVFDEAGEIVYFFASQLDVTRRRVSEQAYRQAQKMEAIGQLTAGLAHDFNNLLQVVTGNLELARGSVTSERAQRQLANAAGAAERGAKLTKQLLSFARKARLEPRPLNLNALVLAFAEVAESTLGRNVSVRLDLTPRLPAVTLDRTNLEMALLNVLINARDAMPAGGTVTISTAPVHLNGNGKARALPPGDYVALRVRDEGEGMPPGVAERATEPFFSTKGPGKGTGLGLAMAHGFVQQSRGRLEIETRPRSAEAEGGTTITMLFPAGHDASTEEEPVEPKAVLRRGDETVLVVEDSDDVRALAREYLESLGYGVLTARDGEEALEILGREARIDLLFSDIVMPGSVNGLVLAERAGRLRPDLPVLLTTGYNEDLVAQGPATPTMDVLGKPYRKAELADRIRSALDRGAKRMPAPGEPHHG
ncbi:PAS domain-containing protein [Methylobacterium sp. IF7SW-B2]|nr:histidine kinase famiy protein [Methylobacterium ajmalii]MBK3398120.1 PAS domain-containing protein [Methylobacterium ajmalii]MBK3406848.1 PAS domain-containing protein [Methylobacterium ajmalii]MBK3420661.1 PAS domain-containing protein [Methylobacterium ajmalii]